MEDSNKATLTAGWPYPGSFIWCREASGGTHPVRKHLRAATKHNNGGAVCEECKVRHACGKLQAELDPAK